MRGLDKNSKEYKALRNFVLIRNQRKTRVEPHHCSEEDRVILTKMFEEYSRGTMACFMQEIMQDCGVQE